MINNNLVSSSSRSQKVVSLSSCESELHSMVSAACDGIFIRSCAEFVLGEEVQHVLFTDSSSARQLASRQGYGRARHVSGKILWLQEKTQDKSILLRQVQPVWNLADIGTKCLSRQHLYMLMHEAGLVYIPSFERVGAEKHDRQSERSAQSNQLRRIAKTMLQLSIAMGLGPVEAGATQLHNVLLHMLQWWIRFGVLMWQLVFCFCLQQWQLSCTACGDAWKVWFQHWRNKVETWVQQNSNWQSTMSMLQIRMKGSKVWSRQQMKQSHTCLRWKLNYMTRSILWIPTCSACDTPWWNMEVLWEMMNSAVSNVDTCLFKKGPTTFYGRWETEQKQLIHQRRWNNQWREVKKNHLQMTKLKEGVVPLAISPPCWKTCVWIKGWQFQVDGIQMHQTYNTQW